MMTRRFTAVLALLAFAGANAAVALHFGHHHEHHAVVLRDAAASEAPHCSCGHHAHASAPAAECGESRHSHPPQRSPHPTDDDGCLICQSLANKPLLTAAVTLVGEGELVAERPVQPSAALRSADRALHFSRGPPTV